VDEGGPLLRAGSLEVGFCFVDFFGGGFAGEDAQVAMAYPRENARTFFEGLAQAGVASGLTLSRSAWIGSQALGGAVWSGDIFSNFTSLQQQIFIAQNVAMSGIYLWTTDIGGFHSGNIHDPSFVELIQRWFQFGVFCRKCLARAPCRAKNPSTRPRASPTIKHPLL
jgi:alpha-glucosidase (family GH31 glycosyl hydrolase)